MSLPVSGAVITTPRLFLRTLEQTDLHAMKRVLQDEQTMYAYAHAFDDREVQAWLDRQRARYAKYGFGLWGVFLRDSGRMIGQCGVTMQDCGGAYVPEIGYLLERAHWHCGYATEAACACRNYAFDMLGFDEVFSIIRDTNFASQRVARRMDMNPRGMFVKHYYGIDMPHICFSVRRT